MTDFETACAIAKQLQVLADGTRLQIIRTIATAGPGTVGNLGAQIGVSFVNVSYHLQQLKAAGLLADKRRGRLVEYSLVPGVFEPSTSGPILGTLKFGDWRVNICGEPVKAVDTRPLK